jgi:hypothetical protein
MRFKVLKSSTDGISGGASDYATIDEVLREVSYHKGWPSLKDLHAAILKWSYKAHPGDVFCTQVTAIVAVAVDRLDRAEDVCHHCGHEGMGYGELSPVEDGNIEQEVCCPGCGERWMDVFTLSEQRTLSKKGA